MSTLCDDLRMSILRSALNGDLTESEEEWNECQLEDLCEEITTGGAAPQGEKNFCNDGPCFVRVVDMGKLGVSKIMHETRDHLSESGVGKLKLFPTGTILFTKSGASLLLNQRAILEKPMYVVSHIGCAIPKSIVSSDFLYLILKGIDFNEYAHATSLPSLKISDLKKVAVKYPSLKQQKIIVEKVDELMARVADLEKSADALASLKKSFPSDARDALLQAAMQGKLTEQLPEDGDAEELLEQIRAEKEKLVAKGAIKKKKRLTPAEDREVPFDIPENWKWQKFGDIVDFNMGKTPPRSESIYWGGDIPWVSIADMPKDGILLKTKEKITAKAMKEKFGSKIVPKGTLIMSFKLTVGRCSILGIDAVHNEAIISIKPIVDKENVFRDYLSRVLSFLSNYGDTKDAIKGKTLNSDSLNNLLIPLPPLAEQKRIVERIDSLLSNINMVEKLIASE